MLTFSLLAITGTFAFPFAAYFIFLSGRVLRLRVKDGHYVGDDSSAKSDVKVNGYNPLNIASRCHQNFIENVPFAFLLAAIVELNGGNRKILTGALGGLLTLRILHAEFGLQGKDATAFGRPVGYFGTIGIIGALAGYASYLVKGYWGF